jgi:chromosome segregation ATPase
MSMEQRITTLEEVYERVLAALRSSNAAMQRLREGAALRDQAMLELGAAVERSAQAIQQMRLSISRLEESSLSVDEALERHDQALQALLAYLPITQAEIVRLDNRIDAVEGA